MLLLLLHILEEKKWNEDREDYFLAKMLMNDEKNIHGEICKTINVRKNKMIFSLIFVYMNQNYRQLWRFNEKLVAKTAWVSIPILL